MERLFGRVARERNARSVLTPQALRHVLADRPGAEAKPPSADRDPDLEACRSANPRETHVFGARRLLAETPLDSHRNCQKIETIGVLRAERLAPIVEATGLHSVAKGQLVG